MKYKKYSGDSYNIYTIKTNRFKACHLEIVFYSKCHKDEVTKRAILCDLFVESSKMHPSKRDVSIALENLYNSFMYSINTRVGSIMATSICFDFINPKYVDNCSLKEFISFPFNMIMNPNIKNGEFNSEEIKSIKSRLECEILSVNDNPQKKSMLNALKAIDADAPFNIQSNGYIDDLKNISNQDLIKYYNTVLENDNCDIYVIGDLDMKEVVKLIHQSFELNTVKYHKYKIEYELAKNIKNKKLIEIDDVAQDQLVIVNKLINLTELEKNAVLYIYNGILSNTSLETKLPKYLREKNSLCYTVSSLYFKYDNLLLIYAGIDAKNYKKSTKIINKVLKDMQLGKISDEEFNNTKKSILTALEMSLDNDASLINSYFLHNNAGVPFIEERMKLINKVTKNDVINVAKKLKPLITYLLKGDCNGRD